jgi:hypothetical protein
MISTETSPRRQRLGLAVIVGLGLSVLSLPAVARVGETDQARSLRSTEEAGPLQAKSGDETALSGRDDAAIVVADNQAFKNNRTWNPNAYNNKNYNNNYNNNYNKNYNKNWNNNWNSNNNWNNNKNWYKNNKNWNKNYSNKYRNKNNFYVRAWQPRPYYGQFFGGIVLGSILTAGAIGIAPPPPNPGLCWYWADPYGYRGYWDYCGPYAPY